MVSLVLQDFGICHQSGKFFGRPENLPNNILSVVEVYAFFFLKNIEKLLARNK